MTSNYKLKLNIKKKEYLWPSRLEDCFQVSVFYQFVFNLPTTVFNQILNNFFQLNRVDYLENHFLLCQEGCFNILIHYNSLTRKKSHL